MAATNGSINCPRCGTRLAYRNAPHPCGWYFESTFLAGQTPRVVDLYRRFADLVQRCGPVVRVPMRTRIGFQANGVIAAVLLRNDWLDAYVVLPERTEHPRFVRIDAQEDETHLHHFTIAETSELDEEVRRWLQRAYQADTAATSLP